MSCFTNLPLINDMKNINWWI